jgi:hypothetical protein
VNKTQALAAAHERSRTNGRSYAYAVETFDATWIVMDRKPTLRPVTNRAGGVIECEDGRETLA